MNNISKCFNTTQMIEIVSKLSSIDTGLDIINECKNKSIIKLKFNGNQLKIRNYKYK